MKQKISISLDDKLIEKITEELEKGIFRNRSHVIEFAVKSLISKGISGGENGR